MQPFITPVDHEARHNNSVENANEATEETPLLTAEQVVESIVNNRSPTAVMSVVMLLIILLIGVSISIYLLIEQQNCLPPVESALVLVSRAQWDKNDYNLSFSPKDASSKATHVIVAPTDTKTCFNTDDCVFLLREMQGEQLNETGTTILPYNYLVSSHGEAYEELGWGIKPEYSNSSYVIGFIGNFTEQLPTLLQMNKAMELFEDSVSQGYLAVNYTIISQNINNGHKHLHQTLVKLPKYDKELSDY